MAFSLKTLLYFFALLAAALAVFGVWGVLAAIGILALRGLATRFWDYRVQVVQWGIVTTAVAMVISACCTIWSPAAGRYGEVLADS